MAKRVPDLRGSEEPLEDDLVAEAGGPGLSIGHAPMEGQWSAPLVRDAATHRGTACSSSTGLAPRTSDRRSGVAGHRRTGSSRVGSVTDLSSLEGVANELQSCEAAALQTAFRAAAELA